MSQQKTWTTQRIEAMVKQQRRINPDDENIGQVVGQNYKIIEPLGEGAMGCVYLGVDTAINRQVAIKVLQKTETQGSTKFDLLQEYFTREAQALAKAQHPSIPKIHHVDVEKSAMVMEYLNGTTMEDFLAKQRQDWHTSKFKAFFLKMMLQVSAALSEAHKHDVFHRDLKPANIMLVKKDGKIRAYVIDFGLAKVHRFLDLSKVSAKTTHQQLLLGTPSYMSPEQWRMEEDVGRKADVFALGCILYEVLVTTPYHDQSIPILEMGNNARNPVYLETRLEGFRYSNGSRIPSVYIGVLRQMLEPEVTRRLGGMLEAQGVINTLVGTLKDLARVHDEDEAARPKQAAVVERPRGDQQQSLDPDVAIGTSVRAPSPPARRPQVSGSGTILSNPPPPGGNDGVPTLVDSSDKVGGTQLPVAVTLPPLGSPPADHPAAVPQEAMLRPEDSIPTEKVREDPLVAAHLSPQPDRKKHRVTYVICTTLLLVGLGVWAYYKFVDTPEPSKSEQRSSMQAKKPSMKPAMRPIKARRVLPMRPRAMRPRVMRPSPVVARLRPRTPPKPKVHPYDVLKKKCPPRICKHTTGEETWIRKQATKLKDPCVALRVFRKMKQIYVQEILFFLDGKRVSRKVCRPLKKGSCKTKYNVNYVGKKQKWGIKWAIKGRPWAPGRLAYKGFTQRCKEFKAAQKAVMTHKP